MTKQESFKRRIRARMTTTGERYAEARRVLTAQSPPSTTTRSWAAAPELSDEAIRAGTDKGWEDWCDLIEQFAGRADGHAAIAQHVGDDLGVSGWWAQAVTVGYERITGLRLPNQMSDGTFTANKSGTVTVESDMLRRLLLDDDDRAQLFPGVATELKSKLTAKAIRVTVGPGSAIIRLEDRSGGRTQVVIQHSQLPTFGDVEEWKFYWAEWLDAIDEAGS
ncbi:hypothetical protein [Salinibacterium sp. TMP30]|uniref:hypothetical protein n=1 Tax=Salinibacterium sp. TMP30 TaxID=3138237 RepID=UPI0031386113